MVAYFMNKLVRIAPSEMSMISIKVASSISCIKLKNLKKIIVANKNLLTSNSETITTFWLSKRHLLHVVSFLVEKTKCFQATTVSAIIIGFL